MAFQYLIDYLYEVGPSSVGGFGQAPLSFVELEAWARTTARRLEPWEFTFLRRLSMEWCSQAEASKDIDCPAPWGDTTPEQRRTVAMSLREEMRAMAK